MFVNLTDNLIKYAINIYALQENVTIFVKNTMKMKI